MQNDILSIPKMWKTIYKLDWCNLCDVATIICPKCGNSSCGGGGCESCKKDMDEFSLTHHNTFEYLTQEERIGAAKYHKLKEFILYCLEQGLSKIDWQYLHKNGQLCLNDYYQFKELENLRKDGIRDYMDNGGSIDTVNKLNLFYQVMP